MEDKNATLRVQCGHRIREMRRKHALTLNELSDKLHTSSSNLSKIECGNSNPTFNLLIELRFVFNKPIDYFLFGYEEEEQSLTEEIQSVVRILNKIEQKIQNLNINM